MIAGKGKHILRLSVGLLCAVMVTSVQTLVYATPSSKEIEGKATKLQKELNNLNSELASLSGEIDNVSAQIEELAAEVEKTKLDVAAAKLNEDAQYESMKDRIKFMYEGGSISLLSIVFASESMSDFLNKAEYVATISEYDREMLDKLHEVRTDVEEKQADLKTKQDELLSLTEELTQKKDVLTSKIDSTSGELTNYNAQLERAKAAEAAAAVARNNEVSGSLGKIAQDASKDNGAGNTPANNMQADSKAPDNTSTGGASESAPAQPTDQGTASAPANTSDVALLAAVLECECGASYEGMLAVGTVIMNRVASPTFPNSISGVIYQKGQFYAAGNSILSSVLSRGPSASAYSAAQAVIGGSRHAAVSNCYFFYSDWYAAQLGVSGVNVAGNVFFESYQY